ncbi:MAG TPA: M28 family peptidase [Polyangia bacterium]|nr:M28 family peptidase [Polyangia bacterium]
MGFPYARGFRLPPMAAVLLAAFACDGPSSVDVDSGPDGSTDADTDADADTDTDTGTGEEFVCEVDPERVFGDVAFLTGDELGGRKAGSEGNELALQMAEAVFEELGLEPAGDDGTFRQAFGFQRAEFLALPSVAVDGAVLTQGYPPAGDYSVFYGSGSANLTAEMIYVGYGMTVPPYDPADYPDCPLPSTGYDDYEGIDVTGKVVIIVRHGPDDDDAVPDTCPNNDLCDVEPCLWNFGYKAANADLHGAAAMIVVQNYGSFAEHMPGTLGTDAYFEDLASVFVDRGIIEASVPSLETWTDGIDASLAPDPHATGVEATFDVSAVLLDVSTANVLGAIPGTDPDIGDEVVVVGGHIDHLGVNISYCDTSGATCYGADDNASGSAVTMELARLASHCANPARTIVFALWNGEEDGLLGSVDYVQHPAFSLASTVAAFSVDMVGAGEDTNLVLYGAEAVANAWLGQVMEGSAAEMGFGWAVTPEAVVEYSDHYPFADPGNYGVAADPIPAVCAMSGVLETHPYYHTVADTIDEIGITHLEMSASMMWAGIKPLVEGTEEQYLTSKAAPEDAAPRRADTRDRLFRDR